MSQKMSNKYETYEIKYPFSYDKQKKKDNMNPWTPGCTFEPSDIDEYFGDWFANGEGKMILTVISRHKPSAKHQERVFYYRSWVDPNGLEFGKNILRVTALSNFTKLAKGFRYKYENVGED